MKLKDEIINSIVNAAYDFAQEAGSYTQVADATGGFHAKISRNSKKEGTLQGSFGALGKQLDNELKSNQALKLPLAQGIISFVTSLCPQITNSNHISATEYLLRWAREILGLPPVYSGSLYSSEFFAHVYALTALTEALTVERREPFILLSSNASEALLLAIRWLKIKTLTVRSVNIRGEVLLPDIEKILATDTQSSRPNILISCMGSDKTGGVDNPKLVGAFCEEYGLEHYVDASLGIQCSVSSISDFVQASPPSVVVTPISDSLIQSESLVGVYLHTGIKFRENLLDKLEEKFLHQLFAHHFLLKSYGSSFFESLILKRIELAKNAADYLSNKKNISVPFNPILNRFCILVGTEQFSTNSIKTNLINEAVAKRLVETLDRENAIQVNTTKLGKVLHIKLTFNNPFVSFSKVKRTLEKLVELVQRVEENYCLGNF